MEEGVHPGVARLAAQEPHTSAEPSALADLLARVGAATKTDPLIDAQLWCLGREDRFAPESYGAYFDPAYTYSINDAADLVARLLPEHGWTVYSTGEAEITLRGSLRGAAVGKQKCATPALALIAAMLKALESRRLEAATPAGE